MKYLPKKPSRLIRLALSDLAKREADPRYEINMQSWHSPHRHTGKCLVCFAGATMARLGAKPTTQHHYQSFGHNNAKKFVALNYFRVGRVTSALDAMNINPPKGVSGFCVVPEYGLDPAGFKRAMQRLADRLEKHGL